MSEELQEDHIELQEDYIKTMFNIGNNLALELNNIFYCFRTKKWDVNNVDDINSDKIVNIHSIIKNTIYNYKKKQIETAQEKLSEHIQENGSYGVLLKIIFRNADNVCFTYHLLHHKDTLLFSYLKKHTSGQKSTNKRPPTCMSQLYEKLIRYRQWEKPIIIDKIKYCFYKHNTTPIIKDNTETVITAKIKNPRIGVQITNVKPFSLLLSDSGLSTSKKNNTKNVTLSEQQRIVSQCSSKTLAANDLMIHKNLVGNYAIPTEPLSVMNALEKVLNQCKSLCSNYDNNNMNQKINDVTGALANNFFTDISWKLNTESDRNALPMKMTTFTSIDTDIDQVNV